MHTALTRQVRSQHLRIETISTGRWLDRVTRLSQVPESKSSGACGRKISKDISKLEQTVKPHCCRSDKLCVTSTLCCLLEEWIHFPSPCPGKDVYNHWNHRRTAVSQLAIETCVFLSTFKTVVGQCEAACVLCEIIFTLRVNLGVLQGFYYRLPASRCFFLTPGFLYSRLKIQLSRLSVSILELAHSMKSKRRWGNVRFKETEGFLRQDKNSQSSQNSRNW